MVYCTKCGELNEEGTEYCKKCGASLNPRSRSRRIRSDRDMCFGVPVAGHIWGILIGAMIVLWGISELVNLDINVFAIVAVAFGLYIVWQATQKDKGT